MLGRPPCDLRAMTTVVFIHHIRCRRRRDKAERCCCSFASRVALAAASGTLFAAAAVRFAEPSATGPAPTTDRVFVAACGGNGA